MPAREGIGKILTRCQPRLHANAEQKSQPQSSGNNGHDFGCSSHRHGLLPARRCFVDDCKLSQDTFLLNLNHGSGTSVAWATIESLPFISRARRDFFQMRKTKQSSTLVGRLIRQNHSPGDWLARRRRPVVCPESILWRAERTHWEQARPAATAGLAAGTDLAREMASQSRL